MLQTDKDFVEIADAIKCNPCKLTKILSDLHLIVILVVYTGGKKEEERANENQA
jgi:hypothetical protein